MHRTDAPDNTSNLFQDGNPSTGQPGTKLEKDWLNAVQEEIAHFIEDAGITLVKGTNTQLVAALMARAAAAATASKLVLRDANGRAAFADPAAAQDAATKGWTEGKQFSRSNLPAVGQQITNYTSFAGQTSTTYIDVIDQGTGLALTATLTTTGRPVIVALQPRGDSGFAGEFNANTASKKGWVALLRDGAIIAEWTLESAGGSVTIPVGAIHYLDTPTAAQHTYKLQVKVVSGGAVSLNSIRLVAFEL